MGRPPRPQTAQALPPGGTRPGPPLGRLSPRQPLARRRLRSPASHTLGQRWRGHPSVPTPGTRQGRDGTPPGPQRFRAPPPDDHRAAPRGQRGARLPAATRGLALAPQASRPLVRGVGLRGIHAPGDQAAARLPSEGAARPLNGGHLLRGRRGGQAGIHQLRPTRQRARQLPAHGLAGGGPQDWGRRRRDHRGGAWCGA